MSFTFSKELSGDIPQLFMKAKAEANIANGSISGDEHSGDFTGKTPLGAIKGTYTVADGILTVSINKKPMLLPESLIRDAFNEYFT